MPVPLVQPYKLQLTNPNLAELYHFPLSLPIESPKVCGADVSPCFLNKLQIQSFSFMQCLLLV